LQHIIGIEPDLTPVRDFLSRKGYTVKNINYGEMTTKKTDQFDAFVVTGMDSDFLGVNDTNSKAVVIDAAGLTPEQIYHELQLRLS
jgi:hypothetical protein